MGHRFKIHWSKRYPICITLNKDQLDFEYHSYKNKNLLEGNKKVLETQITKEALVKKNMSFIKRKQYPIQAQIFSKLTEEEEDYEMESGSSKRSTPSPQETSIDASDDNNVIEELADDLGSTAVDEDQIEDEDVTSLNDWGTFTPEVDTPTETHVYLFGRTGREKEDWYRRFITATHRGANLVSDIGINQDNEPPLTVSDTLITAEKDDTEYLKYMSRFQKVVHLILKRKTFLPDNPSMFSKKRDPLKPEDVDQVINVLWINALIGRVLFDCVRDDAFNERLKQWIQRKISSIKLPYFIEQLSVSELSLGSDPPFIHKASEPVLDHRGLWVDLDITYEGLVVLILQTKLNLMKLKHPATDHRLEDNPSAKWQHSDIEDSAESSTDDENQFTPVMNKVLDEGGFPVAGLGGTSNTTKKFIKMVDKIAESKFFQAATENRYIKKAMEGVSNTELGLKVELKGLVGILVLNIPPPPSDRIWLGFRPMPKLWLSAHPIVGERNITFLKQLTAWIEKKLIQEFQKIMVIPNMEDILIPIMCQKLPT